MIDRVTCAAGFTQRFAAYGFEDLITAVAVQFSAAGRDISPWSCLSFPNW